MFSPNEDNDKKEKISNSPRKRSQSNDYDYIVQIVNRLFKFNVIDYNVFGVDYIKSVYKKFQKLGHEIMFVHDIFGIIFGTFFESNVSIEEYYSHAMAIYNIIQNTETLLISESNNETLECPLCYDEKKNNIMAKCGHKFCRNCIDKYMQDKLSFVCPMCRDTKTQIINKINFDNFIKPLSVDLIHVIIVESYNFLINNKWKFTENIRKTKKEDRKKLKYDKRNRIFKDDEIIFIITLIAKKHGHKTNHIYIQNYKLIYKKIQIRKERREIFDVPNWCYDYEIDENDDSII